MINAVRVLTEPKLMLGGAGLLLGAALLWQVNSSTMTVGTTSNRKSAASGSAATVLPDFKVGGEATAYADIVARPLLNPTRQPAPLQAVSPATEPPKPQIRRGLYELIGVLDVGDKRLAQIRELAANRVLTVKVGEQVQEFRVKSISAESVALEFAGELDEVRLPKFTNSGRARAFAPPPPVAAVPAPVLATPQAQPMPSPQPQVQSAQAAAPAPALVPTPTTPARPATQGMDSRQQAEFLARRQEARRAWGDKM